MGRRTVLLVAAVVVAALGTALIFAYVNRTDERALKDQRPVQVLVAKTLIKAGTSGAEAERQGAFKLQVIPQSATIAGYLTDTRSISPLVAVGDIFPGEQIIPAKFVAPGSSSALTIPTGKLAISVQLGDPERVAGFVAPGSEVAIFVTITPPPPTGGGPAPVKQTRLLLARVTVIAVGPTTLRPATSGGPTNTEALPTAILTLALNQLEAEKVVYASQSGQLYFGLLTKDSKVGPGPSVDGRSLFA
jgi:pilus assembly protein CpaB